MPRRVDHEIRRTEIATAVARIARARGLQGVSFREVAAEAGLSVALVQHYFGSKDGLLIGTLDIESVRLARAIRDRLDRLDPRASPRARLQVIASAFLPTDDDTRDAMLVYHAFAAAALTDAGLRRAEAFRNADRLVDAIADELARARERGELARRAANARGEGASRSVARPVTRCPPGTDRS